MEPSTRNTAPPPASTDTMRAVRYSRYGSPDVLAVRAVDLPAVGEKDILVRVRAAGVNPLDVRLMRGTPYVTRLFAGPARPKAGGLGADAAGVVAAVGAGVTAFRVGDEVFGSYDLPAVLRGGAFAEFAVFGQDAAVHRKPAGLTYEEAAAVPVAAFTALQAVRDKAGVRAGQRVLVNGASGGVGTFAVQIAAAYGAEVTGVCSGGNAELVRSLGAQHVIDYTREDVTRSGRRYDAIVDLAGGHGLAALRRLLTPKGVLVAVGGPVKGLWLSPFTGPLRLVAVSAVVSQRLVPFLTKTSAADLATLYELIEAGKVRVVVERTYGLEESAEAVRHVERGHTRGKVVIVMP